ncbi:HDIG domain-containing metalloprotein [Desulfurivibrio sp. D14AmB]|uniref:HDIG domain-containing metalloprotein n=1 Tax=Desulfurivibrio sp. D14AmB TaxID=3374370 RepID=UPI00376F0838
MVAPLAHPVLRSYPLHLTEALLATLQATASPPPPLFIAGGAVRDWLCGRFSRDLDFTLPTGAVAFARRLADQLGGTLVPLDAEYDVARVVWRELNLDFSGFREGALSIEEDLGERDFTINAMAIPLPLSGAAACQGEVIDPHGGRRDLQAGVIRAVNARVFVADPLRLLRAYRFLASLPPPSGGEVAGAAVFKLAAATVELIAQGVAAGLIAGVAAERIRSEMDAILAGARGAAALTAMATAGAGAPPGSGLLFQVLPELAAGAGLRQPDSHHLDVAAHCIEAVATLERVLAAPVDFFPEYHPELSAYLADPAHPDRALTLRWAALLHDLGKAAACQVREGRIIFHNHDRIGAELCREVARRLRFSRRRRELLQRLVAHHMWPFHLVNASLRQGIGVRACLRLVRSLGDDLPALFLLAMADSLAGRGPGKPVAMEQNLAALYAQVTRVARERIGPVLSLPPLLDGHDLQKLCGLSPGPVFKEILAGLAQARVEGVVNSREEALAWVARFTARRGRPVG